MNVCTDKLNVPGVSEMHWVFFSCLCRIPNFSCLPLLHKKGVRIQNICKKYHFAVFPQEQEKIRSLQKQLRVETLNFPQVDATGYCTDFQIFTFSVSFLQEQYLIFNQELIQCCLTSWGEGDIWMWLVLWQRRAASLSHCSPESHPETLSSPQQHAARRTNRIRET